MRRLAALVLLLSLAGCGSELKAPQAAPSPSSTPSAESTPDDSSPAPTDSPSARSSAAPTAGATSSASATPGAAVVVPPAAAKAKPGQQYSVTALVAHVSGRSDQLCAPSPDQATTGDPTTCAFGIPVVGVDFSKLADRRAKNGDVVGRAALTVTWDSKGVLHMVTQAAPSASVPDPGYRNPPCTPPKGGWPKGKANEQLDLTPIEAYKNKHPGVIVKDVQLRPSTTQVVAYVLTNGSPAQVDKDLRPSYGARFCAFKSTFTTAQLNAADLDPAFRYGRARGVYLRDASGLSLTGQLEEHVGAVISTPALTASVKKSPAGLVRLEQLLTPLP